MLSNNQYLTPLETLALEIGAVSVKVLVTETQTFFIAQFENSSQEGTGICPKPSALSVPIASWNLALVLQV